MPTSYSHTADSLGLQTLERREHFKRTPNNFKINHMYVCHLYSYDNICITDILKPQPQHFIPFIQGEKKQKNRQQGDEVNDPPRFCF